jgi:two-component system, NarL family, nitrate/nitrite response regulator NarL
VAVILVVDDHPLFRDGFAHMARAQRPGWRLHVADRAADALAHCEGAAPDLVVVDVGLPGDDGFALLRQLDGRVPAVLISGREDAAVRVRAQASGARAFLAKTTAPEAMLATLDAVLAGETVFDPAAPGKVPVLTTRQAEVLMLLTEGHGNKEIRHRLGIAERTVRAHLTDLFELLGAHSRTQAIIRAREMGLIG